MFEQSAFVPRSDLRRARGARVLLCGEPDGIRDTTTALQNHGVVITQHGEMPTPPAMDYCDLMILHTHPDDMASVEVAAECCRGTRRPYCVIFSDDAPEARLRAFTLGAADVMSARWTPSELSAHILRLLSTQARNTHARCIHATLRKRMSEQSRMLDHTRLEMVYRLGRAAEYRDNETGQHVVRVGLFSAIVAKHMGMARRQVQLMQHASPLHDIGKIGIADAILLKSGPLSPREWAIMKQHTVIGAAILGGTDDELLEMARVIALTHHERWDGKGYPAGLVRDEIPLCGRIASVCDVYDALTSDRPYKKRWRHTDALTYLRRGRGTQFDPDVVDAFVASLPQIRDIQRVHSDSAAPSNRYCGGGYGQTLEEIGALDWAGLTTQPG